MSNRFSRFPTEQRIQQWWPAENKASVDPAAAEDEAWFAIDHSLSFLEETLKPLGQVAGPKQASAVGSAQVVMMGDVSVTQWWRPIRVPIRVVLSFGYLLIATLVGLLIGTAL